VEYCAKLPASMQLGLGNLKVREPETYTIIIKTNEWKLSHTTK
jgi:hypothetical protein